jgi:uracil-DNA glycosylase family 4
MNSEFDQSLVDELIEEALSDPFLNPERSYGQLGFMETDLVSSIFSAIESKLSNATFLEVVKNARVDSVANTNHIKLTDLHTVTNNCRKCSFSGITPELPKWNVIDPDIVFVLESSAIDQQASAVLVNALKVAGFSSEKVCLTYLLRCPTKSINQDYIDNCVKYLHTEIQIMNPKLICTVGNTVLTSILGTETKIKDYKNKITWLGSWPILPLYSITYALKAGENAIEAFQSDINQAYQFCYKKAVNHDTD